MSIHWGSYNLKKSQHDSIIIEYDSNKMDKTGEKVTPKTAMQTLLDHTSHCSWHSDATSAVIKTSSNEIAISCFKQKE
jgi:hypothetical protein